MLSLSERWIFIPMVAIDLNKPQVCLRILRLGELSIDPNFTLHNSLYSFYTLRVGLAVFSSSVLWLPYLYY